MANIVLLLAAAALALASAAAPKRLIAFDDDKHVWLNETEVESLIFSGAGKRHNFMDITDAPKAMLNGASRARAFPSQPTQRHIVTPLIEAIQIPSMQHFLETLTEFYTRYYTSDTGVQAAEWIYSELVSIKGARDDITVTYFPHTWAQSSIVARIEGAHDGPAGIVILGSHIDSIGSTPTGRSPGAEDDGSGTICNLEAFRVIVESGIVFQRPLEFHFYSAEEVGLRGSQAVANAYSTAGTEVLAMMQLDMTMWEGSAPIAISPYTDFTSPELTAFMRILIDTYCSLGWIDTRCGYACSDHASWFRTGVAASYPSDTIMSKTNPNIHSARDVIEGLSYEHGREFVKLAIAQLVELGNYVE